MTDVRIRRAMLLSVLSPGQNNYVGHLWRAARQKPFQVGRQDVGSNIHMAVGSVSRLLGVLRGVGLLAVTAPGLRLRSSCGGSQPPIRVLTFSYERPDILVSEPTYLALCEANKAKRRGASKNDAILLARDVFQKENRVDLDLRLSDALTALLGEKGVITIKPIPQDTHESGLVFDDLGGSALIRCPKKTIKLNMENTHRSDPVTTPVQHSVRSAQLTIRSCSQLIKRTNDFQLAPLTAEAAPRDISSVCTGGSDSGMGILSGASARLGEEPDPPSGGECPPEPLDNRGSILRRQSDGTLSMGCATNKPTIPDWVWVSLPPYPGGDGWPQKVTPHPPKLSDGDAVTPDDLRICETAYRAAWKLLTNEVLPGQWDPLKTTTKKGGKNPNLTKVGNCVKLLKKHDIRYPHQWAEFRLRQLYFRDGGVPRAGCSKRIRNFVSCFSSKGASNEISREIFKNSRVQERAAWTAAPTYHQSRAIIRWERLKSLVVSNPPKDPALMTELLSEHWPSHAIDRMRESTVLEATTYDREIRSRIKAGDWVWL